MEIQQNAIFSVTEGLRNEIKEDLSNVKTEVNKVEEKVSDMEEEFREVKEEVAQLKRQWRDRGGQPIVSSVTRLQPPTYDGQTSWCTY